MAGREPAIAPTYSWNTQSLLRPVGHRDITVTLKPKGWWGQKDSHQLSRPQHPGRGSKDRKPTQDNKRADDTSSRPPESLTIGPSLPRALAWPRSTCLYAKLTSPLEALHRIHADKGLSPAWDSGHSHQDWSWERSSGPTHPQCRRYSPSPRKFTLIWGLRMFTQDIISNQFVYNILQIFMEVHLMEHSHEFKHRGFPSELVSPPQEHFMMLFHQIARIFVFANLNIIVLKSNKSHHHFPVTFWNFMSKFIIDPIGSIVGRILQIIFMFIFPLHMMEGGGHLCAALQPAGSGSTRL